MRVNIVCPISSLFFRLFLFLPKRLCVSIDAHIRRCSDVETPNRRHRQRLGRIHTERLQLWLCCAVLLFLVAWCIELICLQHWNRRDKRLVWIKIFGVFSHWRKADENAKQTKLNSRSFQSYRSALTLEKRRIQTKTTAFKGKFRFRNRSVWMNPRQSCTDKQSWW